MASIRKQASGSWRVQVRRKGRSVSETFVRHEDARQWATDAERQIDRGQPPRSTRAARVSTFGDLIDLHIADMTDVGRAPRRSKAATLAMLKRDLGSRTFADLDRERLVGFGRRRAADGPGNLVAGQVQADVRQQIRSREGRTFPALDDGVDTLTEVVVRQADDGGRQHFVVAIERRLDLRRIDVGAAGQDQVRAPVDQVEVAPPCSAPVPWQPTSLPARAGCSRVSTTASQAESAILLSGAPGR